MDSVQICNLAIGWCGGNPIMSLDPPDDSDEAELCFATYDATRDLVLEARDWTFAAARATLAPMADVDAGEVWPYNYRFMLPSDLLVVRQVSDGPDMRPIEYVKEQRTIITDAATLYIKYTVKVTNEQIFSPTFNYAFAYAIAASICNPLTHSQSMTDKFELKAQYYLESGGSIDGTQTVPGRAYASKILNARRRNY